jgi:hypothetical protein
VLSVKKYVLSRECEPDWKESLLCYTKLMWMKNVAPGQPEKALQADLSASFKESLYDL